LSGTCKRIHILFRFQIMKKLTLLFLIIFVAAGYRAIAQDTLPRFSARNVGNNRIVIEWHNQFQSVKQISIQRSTDSLKNFKTILTVADPTLPENGYLDTKATSDRMFYRLYIMLDKGVFMFSDTRRPVLDTVVAKRGNMIRTDNPNLVHALPTENGPVGPVVNNNVSKPKNEAWVPSKFVYTTKDGTIRITLPEDPDKKYSLKFFTLRDELLFELKDVKEKSFKLDKSNFYHAGWFKFELYENDELKEKNRFYLAKEF
jgi:hypothetical protein